MADIPVGFGSEDTVAGELAALGMTEGEITEVLGAARAGRSPFPAGVPTSFGHVLYCGGQSWEISYRSLPAIPARRQLDVYAVAPDGDAASAGTAVAAGHEVTCTAGQAAARLSLRTLSERAAWRALAEASAHPGAEVVLEGIGITCVGHARYALVQAEAPEGLQ
jgi:hypothetical protein